MDIHTCEVGVDSHRVAAVHGRSLMGGKAPVDSKVPASCCGRRRVVGLEMGKHSSYHLSALLFRWDFCFTRNKCQHIGMLITLEDHSNNH